MFQMEKLVRERAIFYISFNRVGPTSNGDVPKIRLSGADWKRETEKSGPFFSSNRGVINEITNGRKIHMHPGAMNLL